MFDINKIKSISDVPEIIEFSEFILSKCSHDDVPELEISQLIEVPVLVTRTFVMSDVPDKNKRLLMKYSGTKIDEQFNRNITGEYFEDLIKGDDCSKIIQNFYDVLQTQKVGFLRHKIELNTTGRIDQKHVSRISFPCLFNNEKSIIGQVIFSPYNNQHDEVITLI